MQIHSTSNVCVIVLPNGLRLEVSFDLERLVPLAAHGGGSDASARRIPHPSLGTWLFRDEMLFEAKVGQA